jgi:hypothetical protein
LFLDWIALPAKFCARRARGCGTGCHSHFASQFGAKDVIAVDQLSRGGRLPGGVRVPNCHVVKDIPGCRCDVASSGIDFIYSIGVLHHAGPEAGLVSLCRFSPGARSWLVYGHEGNQIVHI